MLTNILTKNNLVPLFAPINLTPDFYFSILGHHVRRYKGPIWLWSLIAIILECDWLTPQDHQPKISIPALIPAHEKVIIFKMSGVNLLENGDFDSTNGDSPVCWRGFGNSGLYIHATENFNGKKCCITNKRTKNSYGPCQNVLYSVKLGKGYPSTFI